jgi:hypothetical protein
MSQTHRYLLPVVSASNRFWNLRKTDALWSTNRMVGLVVDTPLLDRCKVDIETPDQRGIVIRKTSQQLSAPETAKDTILFLVELAASMRRRYDRITDGSNNKLGVGRMCRSPSNFFKMLLVWRRCCCKQALVSRMVVTVLLALDGFVRTSSTATEAQVGTVLV